MADRPLAPRVPAPWLTGSAVELLRDPLGTYMAGRAHGDVVTMRVGPPRLGTTACALYHPDAVQHVLATAAAAYPKSDPSYVELRRWFGDGLLTTEGPDWQARRRTLQPLFTARQVAEFDAPMLREIGQLVRHWDERCHAGEPVDLHGDITALTVRVVSRVLLGGDADDTLATIMRTYPVLNRQVLRRMTSVVPLPHRLPFPGNVRARRAKAQLFDAARAVVRRRTARPGRRSDEDLLDLLLAAREPETGEALSEDDVVREIVTFLLAGHETSATALTAALHLLATHDDAQERLREEVVEVLGDRAPQAADVPRLEFTAMVFHEALRLYPPSWGLPRLAAQDDALGGYHVPAGTMVVTSPWVVQRDARWWPEPERFCPQRWAPEHQADRHRYAWFPFGGGPRRCIGQHFALQEAVFALSMIVQHFRLRAVRETLEIEAGVTVRPRGAVRAVLEAREPRAVG